jgi:quercetin dioxygenase-like cupin family protein
MPSSYGGAGAKSIVTAPNRTRRRATPDADRRFCAGIRGAGNHLPAARVENEEVDRSGKSIMRYITLAPLLFLAGSAAGIPFGFALSQVSPQVRVEILLEQMVSDIPQPAHVRVHDDRWDPGAETGVHDHPGPAILAVIEGDLVEERPAGRNILRAGNVVWRAANQPHNVKNTGNRPARILAIHFDPIN